jgi:hypothetical protein
MRGKSDIRPTSLAPGSVKVMNSFVMISQRFDFICPRSRQGLADPEAICAIARKKLML